MEKLGVSLGVVQVIVTGAGGKLGRLLRAAWQEAPPEGLQPVWAGRGEGHDLQWDILADPPPALPRDALLLHLAGVLRGPAEALGRNAAMIAPLAAACRRAGVRRLFHASTAAVYAPGPDAARETDVLAPANAYGQAKAAAEAALAGEAGLTATVLRIGNVAGADALLGPRADSGQPILLDPVPGTDTGPRRSWIGPKTLAAVLARLCRIDDLPPVLNLACAPPLGMAQVLAASGLSWQFGPSNPAVVPVATLATGRLAGLVDLPEATPALIAAEAAWARSVLA